MMMLTLALALAMATAMGMTTATIFQLTDTEESAVILATRFGFWRAACWCIPKCLALWQQLPGSLGECGSPNLQRPDREARATRQHHRRMSPGKVSPPSSRPRSRLGDSILVVVCVVTVPSTRSSVNTIVVTRIRFCAGCKGGAGLNSPRDVPVLSP